MQWLPPFAIRRSPFAIRRSLFAFLRFDCFA